MLWTACFACCVVLARDRLVGHIFDRLGIAFPRHREIDGHGGKRHDQAHVLVVVVAVADLLHRPNHLEGHAIDQELLPTAGRPGNRMRTNSLANDADVVALPFVVPIQPAPLVEGLVANVVELRLGAIHVAVAAAIVAHQAKVAAVNHRRSIADIAASCGYPDSPGSSGSTGETKAGCFRRPARGRCKSACSLRRSWPDSSWFPRENPLLIQSGAAASPHPTQCRTW